MPIIEHQIIYKFYDHSHYREMDRNIIQDSRAIQYTSEDFPNKNRYTQENFLRSKFFLTCMGLVI